MIHCQLCKTLSLTFLGHEYPPIKIRGFGCGRYVPFTRLEIRERSYPRSDAASVDNRIVGSWKRKREDSYVVVDSARSAVCFLGGVCDRQNRLEEKSGSVPFFDMADLAGYEKKEAVE